MQIQKGLVKYKDRSDIVCTYGLTDDGMQYYFLDGNTLANGNIIASTVLVEAIDPVVSASSIGVIDAEGNVVVPFENKSIKVVNDELLLVERSNSITPSVVEAISLRSDPLAATKLVTTAAAIKDNMNAKMGSDGRFIFNDQFSEATICDINGNNIIDDQYYSFIGMKNNESLYFSKNTTDSVVVEYSLLDRMFIAPQEAENLTTLDVQNTDISQDLIDVAMGVEEKVVGFGAEDITAKDFEAVANEKVNAIDGSLPVEEPLPVELSSDNTSVESVEQEKNFENEEQFAQEDVIESIIEKNSSENLVDSQTSVNYVSAEEQENDNNDLDNLVPFDFGDNINYSEVVTEVADSSVEGVVSEFKNDLFDVDLDSDIFADSILHADKIDVIDNFDYDYKVTGTKDNIMEDVATTMTNLINLNRSQRQKLVVYEEKFEQAAVAHKKIVEKLKGQIRDIETLKGKLKNYETIVTKLESKITVLENKVHDQDKVIASQSRELESLRPQIEGKEELAKILADAQSLLEQQ